MVAAYWDIYSPIQVLRYPKLKILMFFHASYLGGTNAQRNFFLCGSVLRTFRQSAGILYLTFITQRNSIVGKKMYQWRFMKGEGQLPLFSHVVESPTAIMLAVVMELRQIT